MDISKFITICAFYTFYGLNFVLSLPTFGGEHVHIKVHISHEAKHPVIHHTPKHHVKHKIIHHYHSHQRPVKTLAIKEKTPLLENLYLAELDKPHIQEHLYHHAQGPQHIEEIYLVKEQHHHHVKPVEEVNTINVIEGHEHHHKHRPHLEYAGNHVDTIKLILESGKEQRCNKDHDQHYRKEQDHHVEAFKFDEEKPQYHYNHEEKPVNYDYHEPKEEVIQAPIYTSSAQDYGHHYGHEPQVEQVVEEEPNYHDYHETQTKRTVPKRYNNHDPKDPLVHGIIEESLETKRAKTKKVKNHNYDNYYLSHYGYQPPKEQEISKPQDQHHHHYSHQPEISVKEHIPTTHHYSEHASTSAFLESTHHYATNSAPYEHQSYDSKHKYATDYKQILPSSETSTDLNESHKKYHKKNTFYNDLNTKDDYSKDVENPLAPETYRGHDSYSAGHVQGLDSGGYRNHLP